MSRALSLPLLVFVLLAAPACGGSDGGDSASPTPPTTIEPLTTAPPAGESPPPTSVVVQSATLGSVVVADTDEVYLDETSGQLIHRDSTGVYICVLLRTDDLAALRARAVQSSDVEEAAP